MPIRSLITTKAFSEFLSAIAVTNIYKSFTYKMAAKMNWHRYRTKLRHCHHMYNISAAEHCHCMPLHRYMYSYQILR